MMSLFIAMTMTDPLLETAIKEAIEDEIQIGLEATSTKNIDLYMDGVPDDVRIVEEDGTITDKARLREMQLQAWSIIPKTNSNSMTVTDLEVGCDGECATVWTDQRWDRQMLSRDGETEHNVVTTQAHREHWELRDSRWRNIETIELGGTVTVDGEAY